MLTLVLLAQIATATPAPTPAARLGSASASVSAKPKTLADLARERKLGKTGVPGGTLSVSGATGGPAAPLEADVPSGSGASDGKARLRNAQADVKAARRAVDDAAVRTGMTSEDAAAARKRLADARRELSEAQEAAARSGR